MAYFIRIGLIACVAGFCLGAVELEANRAIGQTDAERVSILSGFETSAADRTRTIIRTRRRGDRLVVDKWRVPLGADRELEGGQNGAAQRVSARASTGRSVQVQQHGVRVINSRRSPRNVIRIR